MSAEKCTENKCDGGYEPEDPPLGFCGYSCPNKLQLCQPENPTDVQLTHGATVSDTERWRYIRFDYVTAPAKGTYRLSAYNLWARRASGSNLKLRVVLYSSATTSTIPTHPVAEFESTTMDATQKFWKAVPKDADGPIALEVGKRYYIAFAFGGSASSVGFYSLPSSPLPISAPEGITIAPQRAFTNTQDMTASWDAINWAGPAPNTGSITFGFPEFVNCE